MNNWECLILGGPGFGTLVPHVPEAGYVGDLPFGFVPLTIQEFLLKTGLCFRERESAFRVSAQMLPEGKTGDSGTNSWTASHGLVCRDLRAAHPLNTRETGVSDGPGIFFEGCRC